MLEVRQSRHEQSGSAVVESRGVSLVRRHRGMAGDSRLPDGCSCLIARYPAWGATISSSRPGSDWYLAPLLSSSIVGSALALRHPGHPVGWLFLAFGFSLAVSGAIDAYAAYGAVARPGSLPAATFVAVIGDATFIPWLMLLGLIMLFTPGGMITERIWRIAAWTVVIGGGVSFVCKFFRPYQGDYANLGIIKNPLEFTRLAPVLNAVGVSALLVMHVGVIMGAVSLVVRYRVAHGKERVQLRWLAWSALPFALFIVGAFIAATLDRQTLLGWMAGCFVSIIPISAALAIEQYHLYDVERLVSRALSWVLLSAVLVSCYVLVVVFVGESLGSRGGGSSIPSGGRDARHHQFLEPGAPIPAGLAGPPVQSPPL